MDVTLFRVLYKHEIPQLTHRHPELIPPLLSTILELGINYTRRIKEEEQYLREKESLKEQHRLSLQWEDEDEEPEEPVQMTDDFRADIAAMLLKRVEYKWAPVATGVACLDDLLGSKHGILQEIDDGNTGGGGGGAAGVGLFDGIWVHSGWSKVHTLQSKLSQMTELREMIKEMGQRASSKGNQRRRFPPTTKRKDGVQSVASNPHLPSDMQGLKFGNSLSALQFRDAMLLSGSKRLRALFLSRYAERGLTTYEYVDWEDELSRPKRTKSSFTRLPTAVGGAIIVCLDTSWSMAGPREMLAKSVVLECASMAARMKRDVFVLAFSGRGNIAECDLKLTSDREGLQKLLDFLSGSFQGGTDVVAPLRRAMDLMNDSQDNWSCADIILVTDGELSNPPLDEDTKHAVDRMMFDRELRIHGLLVGKNESKPLESICGQDGVHNFLNKYDELSALSAARVTSSREEASFGSRRTKGSTSSSSKTRLFASASDEISSESWSIHERVRLAVAAMEEGLIERSVEARLIVLAVLSREHLLLLGPPGTGKSELGRRLSLLSNGRFFERLLTRYTQPEELFGPFSLRALENDQYIRNTEGFLPTASVAFVDEVFKANSAILNTLLTILNERKFDNGNVRVDVPLIALIGASNELPDSDELEALYDRFIFRRAVSQVSDEGLSRMLSYNDEIAVSRPNFDLESVIAETSNASQNISIPSSVLDIVIGLRRYLRDEITPPIACSDRRLRKAVTVMKVAAASAGRSEIGLLDTLLLQYILWSKKGDDEIIRDWILKHVVPEVDLEGIRYILDSCLDRLDAAIQRNDKDLISEELEYLKETFVPLLASKLAAVEGLEFELSINDERISVWLDESDILLVKQSLLPKARALKSRAEELYLKAETTKDSIEKLLREEITVDDVIIPSAGTDLELEFESAGQMVFTPAILQMSKREAQRALSAEDFRRWKKEQRKLRSISDDSD